VYSDAAVQRLFAVEAIAELFIETDVLSEELVGVEPRSLAS